MTDEEAFFIPIVEVLGRDVIFLNACCELIDISVSEGLEHV